MRMVLAPYWVNYHLEHHLFVFTPLLEAACRPPHADGRKALGRAWSWPPGYLAVLRQAVSKPHDGPSQGKTGDPRKRAALI